MSTSLKKQASAKSLDELVTDRVYKAEERDQSMGRSFIFTLKEVMFDDGNLMLVGIDLATGLRCSLFEKDWSFQDLTPLELELL